MKTPSASLRLGLALVAALSITLAACAGAAAPTRPASPPASAPASPSPSGGGSASTGPDSPVGAPSDPGAGGGSGSGGGDVPLIPRPGTIDPHPVAVEKIERSIDGRHVTVKLTWTSGVAPCYVLDSVIVSRDGNDIALTVVEGSADPNAMCIELAQTKSTIVDLGELEPGEYTIAATDSQIPPVTITVS
jgi:hypothetical protein